jgi:hypothetical protein
MEVIDVGTLWTDQPARQAALRVAALAQHRRASASSTPPSRAVSTQSVRARDGRVASGRGAHAAEPGRTPSHTSRRGVPR